MRIEEFKGHRRYAIHLTYMDLKVLARRLEAAERTKVGACAAIVQLREEIEMMLASGTRPHEPHGY